MFTPLCEVSIIVLFFYTRTQHFGELLVTPTALGQEEGDAASLVSDIAAFLSLGCRGAGNSAIAPGG